MNLLSDMTYTLRMGTMSMRIKRNVINARVFLITDRTDLDEQIEKVFRNVGEKPYRTKSGKDLIEKLSYTDKGMDFLNAQLKITFEIIERANPKLIIVSNALASEFFGKKKETKHRKLDKIWKGFDLYFDKNIWKNDVTFNSKIGTYEIKLNDKLVPIIFSGMLSGQRALDIGSLERLKWQSKMILESRTKK